jgi:hypothetical protein
LQERKNNKKKHPKKPCGFSGTPTKNHPKKPCGFSGTPTKKQEEKLPAFLFGLL